VQKKFRTTFTHGEVPAYNIAGMPWSKAECPTEGSGHGALRNGHAGATTSAAGIWVEGGTPPGTAMRLLFVCCQPAHFLLPNSLSSFARTSFS